MFFNFSTLDFNVLKFGAVVLLSLGFSEARRQVATLNQANIFMLCQRQVAFQLGVGVVYYMDICGASYLLQRRVSLAFQGYGVHFFLSYGFDIL